MLTYNHIFNENLDYPFHVHVIDSDTTSVAINLNGSSIGYFRTTSGTKYSFTKHTAEFSILDLMVVGTRQEYDKSISNSFFKDSTVKYIKNPNGAFLVKNNETQGYYWSTSSRTRFFFNPDYFNNKVLWEFVIGYVPKGKIINDIWSEEEAKDLFLSQVYETTETWGGEKTIVDVEPLTIDHFDTSTSGIANTFFVDTFINELQDLIDGDEITIDNGIEKIELTVKNIYTKAEYETVNITTRSLIHVEIDIVNPNKLFVYTKALDINDQEDIEITIANNDLAFSIERVEEI